jgi:hypothetical protein
MTLASKAGPQKKQVTHCEGRKKQRNVADRKDSLYDNGT